MRILHLMNSTEEMDTWRTVFPLPVAPDFMFPRLAAQNGTFTVHGTKTGSVEELIPDDKRDMLLKFVAKRSAVSAVYNCIDLIMPSSDAMFPDIEGMKDYIV